MVLNVALNVWSAAIEAVQPRVGEIAGGSVLILAAGDKFASVVDLFIVFAALSARRYGRHRPGLFGGSLTVAGAIVLVL